MTPEEAQSLVALRLFLFDRLRLSESYCFFISLNSLSYSNSIDFVKLPFNLSK